MSEPSKESLERAFKTRTYEDIALAFDAIRRGERAKADALILAAYEACANVEFDERPIGDPNPRYEAAWGCGWHVAILTMRKAIRSLSPDSARRAMDLREGKARLEGRLWEHEAICEDVECSMGSGHACPRRKIIDAELSAQSKGAGQ